MDTQTNGSAVDASIAARCSSLSKRYGDLMAVDRLDLEIRRGECFGILGPNGAGKTTTMEMLEGLKVADAGFVELLGARWNVSARSDRALRARIGIQLQETELADKLTVSETLRLFRSFHESGSDPEELILQLGLEEERDARLHQLSGGKKQRVALGCALVGGPDLVFLDEPTTGLDPLARQSLWQAVHAFRARGGTVILTTHYMEEAESLCDRVAIIDAGRCIASGAPSELIASFCGDEVIELSVSPALADDVYLRCVGVKSVHARRGVQVLGVTSGVAVLPSLLELVSSSGSVIQQLRTHRATLEDVFTALTGRRATHD